MKKIIALLIILFPFSLIADEKPKDKKVAKYVMENIQKDYVNCYSFYKVAAESFKKAGKDKQVIDSLEASADVALKYNYDLGEIMGLIFGKKRFARKIKRVGVKSFGVPTWSPLGLRSIRIFSSQL